MFAPIMDVWILDELASTPVLDDQDVSWYQGQGQPVGSKFKHLGDCLALEKNRLILRVFALY